jgi:integrase
MPERARAAVPAGQKQSHQDLSQALAPGVHVSQHCEALCWRARPDRRDPLPLRAFPVATAATNAFQHEADIAKVQEWLGHSDISTTRMYDRRQSRPEDSLTFKVRY